MRFKGLDLNLLLALHILLEERSVSRAAERLNVSQPAMSASLTRLREYFGDPILQLHGRKMIPTAHAMGLKLELAKLLSGVEGLIAKSTQFDPANAERTFRVSGSDYIFSVLFAGLNGYFEKHAPNITLELIQNSDASHSRLDQGGLDLMIAPEAMLSGSHPKELLFVERHVVVGWRKNPALKGGKISKKDFMAAPQVISELGQLRRASFAETSLPKSALERKIAMRVSSFLVAPYMVIGTSWLTVMHERLARLMSKNMDITIAALPFKIPAMREMAQYHDTRREDPGLRWLIDQLKRHAEDYT